MRRVVADCGVGVEGFEEVFVEELGAHSVQERVVEEEDDVFVVGCVGGGPDNNDAPGW